MDSTFSIISESDVAAVLSYADLIPLMRQTLIEFSQGKIIQPARQMLAVEEQQRYLGIMPAAAENSMGAKLVCFYPKNAGTPHHTHLASIILIDSEFGIPLACLDGRLITEMRTAATSAAIASALTAPESRSLALLGSGVQAKAHLQALKHVFPIDDVRVWSRNANNAEAFATEHGAAHGSIAEAVDGADIIVCATNAREPVLPGAKVKKGALVISVGSPRPDWRELDDEVMQNPVIVDSEEAARLEAGDVILSGAPIFAEAGQILSGEKSIEPGTTTVFKSVGIACEDLAAARLVYDRHISRGPNKPQQ